MPNDPIDLDRLEARLSRPGQLRLTVQAAPMLALIRELRELRALRDAVATMRRDDEIDAAVDRARALREGRA